MHTHTGTPKPIPTDALLRLAAPCFQAKQAVLATGLVGDNLLAHTASSVCRCASSARGGVAAGGEGACTRRHLSRPPPPPRRCMRPRKGC